MGNLPPGQAVLQLTELGLQAANSTAQHSTAHHISGSGAHANIHALFVWPTAALCIVY